METLVIGVELDLPQAEIDALAASTAGITDGMEEGLSGVNDELGGMADGAEGASGSVRGLSSVTRLFSADLAKGAAGVLALTRGVAGFSVALGPAVIAVGALLVVTKLWGDEQDRMNAIAERAAIVTDYQKAANERLRDVYLDLAVVAGDLSQKERAILKARTAQFTQALPATQEFIRQISEQSRAVSNLKASWIQQTASARDAQSAADAQAASYTGNTDAVSQAQASSERLNATVSETAQKLHLARTALVESQFAFGKHRDTIRLLVEKDILLIEKEAALAAGLKGSARAAEEAERAAAELATARGFVAGVEAAAMASMETGAERLIRLRDEQLAKLLELDMATQGTADTDAARAALVAATHQELMEIRSADLARLEQEKDAAFDKEMARIAKERSVRIASMNTIAGGLGALSGIALQAAREQAGTDKAAAEAALKTSKRLAVAEATVALGAGLINIASIAALRPLAAAISLAALFATYGAQLASIQSTSLHAGGFRGAPDEVRGSDGVTRTIGERTISPTGSRQEEQIRRIERGGGGQRAQLVPVYRHFGRFSRDELRRQSPLSGAISAASRLSGPGRY